MYNTISPCIVSKCPNYSVSKGRCADHQLTGFKSNRKERLPDDWNWRRNFVLKRDNGVCYLCGEPGADSVDHIVAGDDHSLENLAPAHQNIPPYCHRKKTAQDANQAKKDNAPSKSGQYWVNEYYRRLNG